MPVAAPTSSGRSSRNFTRREWLGRSLALPIVALLALCLCANLVTADEFPRPYDSEKETATTPLPPEQVAREMKLPPGFKATVFAAEPDVCNPIALAWDAKGRLWVAENYTYAESPIKFEKQLRDRVLILEDTDGDGRHDKRTVFYDELQQLTSVEVGRGGVWLMCPPQVLFIPDRDGDDRPDSKPEVVLDGFTIPPENYHNLANGLRFGPDGWLYGRCGASAPGEIGTPGTPAAERIPMRGGIWRYSPRTKVFEALTSGTTNPWGHDWDRHGELFYINTVNGHLWHMMPGAHFVRPHTIDPNPRVYEPIDTHADHWHFDTAKGWSKSRDDAVSGSLGGGHAHIGCFIYNDTAWPKEYHGRLFTLNMHGRRANQERLERDGSGYVAKHEPDFLVVNDPWFRGMELTLGPDGGLYIADWCDAGECHERTGVHRSSGRIYKVQWHNLSNTSIEPWPNRKNEDWFHRQSLIAAATALDRIGSRADPTAHQKLLGVGRDVFLSWQVVNFVFDLRAATKPDDAVWLNLLKHENQYVTAWAIRFLTEDWPLDTMMSARPARAVAYPASDHALLTALVNSAKFDPSPLVRLTLASTLQRLPHADRLPLAKALCSHSEDDADHNLPLMIWYGLIPTADEYGVELAALAADCRLPTTRKLIARRLAEDVEKKPDAFNALLAAVAMKGDAALAADVTRGSAAALAGWRKAPVPSAWEKFAALASKSDDEEIQNLVRELSVVFGDGRALDEVKRIAMDEKASLDARKAALATLIDARPEFLRGVCERTIKTRFLNPLAAQGLGLFDDDEAAALLVDNFKSFHPSERAKLIAVLASRPRFAKALLTAVAAGKVGKESITAFTARQIHDFNDAELRELLKQTWGEFRDSPAEKKQLIADLKQTFTKAELAKADRSQGRALFAKTCAACHKFFGEGQTVGPDLTGANRDNLDYLLENIIDPSAVVTADFRMSVLQLDDGRVLNGLVLAETERTLTLRTATETLTVEKGSVEERRTVPLSLMPENQLQTLTPEQRRDLFGYLQTREQVPLPAE
jgi:putative membrane-bound dehydrogenase-like protein